MERENGYVSLVSEEGGMGVLVLGSGVGWVCWFGKWSGVGVSV